MKPKRDRAAVMASVLSHVGIIYKSAMGIGGRAGICKNEATYWLGLLTRQLDVERRRLNGHYEYRLNLKRRDRR